MVAFVGLLAAVTMVLWRAPDAPASRVLHRHLVERPLAALVDFERHHLIYLAIMLGFALGGLEALAMLGPEVVAAFALDLAIYIDAVLLTYSLSAAMLARRSVGRIRHAAARIGVLMRPRARRARRPARPRRPANDADEDHPQPALLAA